jgi:hypothetical protein
VARSVVFLMKRRFFNETKASVCAILSTLTAYTAAIVREIGERLRTSLNSEPELPASLKMQIDRLRELEEQSSSDVEH